MPHAPLDRFQKLALSTTAATYLLIAVGSLVRVSGSGLGCPDWPKCFGRYIPPLDASELPPGYDPAQFVVWQTWIEYLNRLLGAVIGLLIFATLVAAIVAHRKNRHVVTASALAFVGVGFEGWLGKMVVEHELASWTVTVHLLGALVVVALLLWATFHAFVDDRPNVRAVDRRSALAASAVLALVVVQVALGATVRAHIDDAIGLLRDVERARWIEHAGPFDLPHRQVAILVIVGALALFVDVRRRRPDAPWLVTTTLLALALAGLQIAGGLVLAYGAMPAAAQIVHLLAASLLVGALTIAILLAVRGDARGAQPSPSGAGSAGSPSS